MWLLLRGTMHGRACAIGTVEPGWERVLLLPLTRQLYIILLRSHLLSHHLRLVRLLMPGLTLRLF